MALKIVKGETPPVQFRTNKYPDLVEALETMPEDEWLGVELGQEDKSSTIRNMVYRYTKEKWLNHKAKVRVTEDSGVETIWIMKRNHIS